MLEKKATIIPLYKRTIDELKQENRQLRTLLHYNKSLEKAFITARVISNIGGAYAQTLLLNRGALSKVRPGLAVIDERGLLGRIVSVSANSSRVLLLTDSNSSIPAMIQETNQPVILNGDGSNNPILTFLSYRYAPKIGNTIITSGYGGALPPGIPLGKVISITRPFKVKLFAEIPESPYVRIVQFQYTSIKEK